MKNERILTKEEFVARQAKRKAERKEMRNFTLGLITFSVMSYATVWIISAIAMIH
jgi:hypothetical protein